MKAFMTKFWFIAIILFIIYLLIGCVGIFENLVMGDPDEWVSIGQFMDGAILLVISLCTYKALSYGKR